MRPFVRQNHSLALRGAPQNSAVGFWIGDDDTIVTGGLDLGNSRKFKNVERNAKVSFLVEGHG